MPWELHGTKRYYYRRRRVNGRSQGKYIGGGLIGELAAIEDLQRRQAREQVDSARRAEQQSQSLADKPLRGTNQLATLLLRSVLLGTGAYRQHDRGKWRHIREDRSHSSQSHVDHLGK